MNDSNERTTRTHARPHTCTHACTRACARTRRYNHVCTHTHTVMHARMEAPIHACARTTHSLDEFSVRSIRNTVSCDKVSNKKCQKGVKKKCDWCLGVVPWQRCPMARPHASGPVLCVVTSPGVIRVHAARTRSPMLARVPPASVHARVRAHACRRMRACIRTSRRLSGCRYEKRTQLQSRDFTFASSKRCTNGATLWNTCRSPSGYACKYA